MQKISNSDVIVYFNSNLKMMMMIFIMKPPDTMSLIKLVMSAETLTVS